MIKVSLPSSLFLPDLIENEAFLIAFSLSFFLLAIYNLEAFRNCVANTFNVNSFATLFASIVVIAAFIEFF